MKFQHVDVMFFSRLSLEKSLYIGHGVSMLNCYVIQGISPRFVGLMVSPYADNVLGCWRVVSVSVLY